MLFRYKITTCGYDSFDKYQHGFAIRYYVQIQYLKSGAKLFKWRKFDDTRFCCMLENLGHQEECLYTLEAFKHVIEQYKGVDEIVLKYIKQEVQKRNFKNEKNKLEKEMDNLILTNGWNTIEIKENE